MIKRLLLSAAAAALSASAAGAQAQAVSATPGAEATKLSEVIVTAQRRKESAQDLPIALSVLSGKDLTTRGVDTVNLLQYQTPSLEVEPAFGGGQPQFRIRGVGFSDYASNNTSPVTVYVDEVAYALPIQTQGLLFDIDRVEVLRGPQGTLYGQNTTGGAVNFVTRAPAAQFSAGLSAEYGSYDESKVEGYISGPISDTVRVRISGVSEQGGAWQTNRTTGESIGDADKYAVRAQVAWDATSSLNFLLDLHFNRDRSDGQALYLFAPLNVYGVSQPADTNPAHTGWGASAAFASLVGIGQGAKPFKDNTGLGLDLRSTLDLGFAKLISITAYDDFRRSEYEDWDASAAALAGTYFNDHVQAFSQELRLASNDKPDSPIKWVAGLHYANQDLTSRFDSDFFQSLGFVANTTYRQQVDSIGAFGQVDYRLTDKVTLILGLRDDQERRAIGDFETAGIFAPGAAQYPFITPYGSAANRNMVSGKAEIEYRPERDLLTYASISHGAKSGGFTAYNTPDVRLLHFIEPESLWAGEVGFKSDLLDHSLRINGSAFYYDYHDQQVQSAIYTPADGPIGNIVNADSYIYGGELELDWKPVRDLLITQNLGYKKGVYTNFEDLNIDASVLAGQAVYVQRKGQDEGYPAISYSGAADYRWRLGWADVDAEVDYSYRDRSKPVLLGPTYDVAAYWLTNANIALTPAGSHWSISVFGRNIFDQRYDLTRNFFLPGISIAAPGRPATFGVRVSTAF